MMRLPSVPATAPRVCEQNFNLKMTPTPERLMRQAKQSPKLMKVLKNVNLRGQEAVSEFYNHQDGEVREFVKNLCDVGFQPAGLQPPAAEASNPFSRPMSYYMPRSGQADRSFDQDVQGARSIIATPSVAAQSKPGDATDTKHKKVWDHWNTHYNETVGRDRFQADFAPDLGESDPGFEPYPRAHGSNVVTRGGWPTQGAYHNDKQPRFGKADNTRPF